MKKTKVLIEMETKYQSEKKQLEIEKLGKQKKILDATFEDWKGKREQIDDITLLGIRI